MFLYQKHIWRNVRIHHLLTNESSAMNGCRQNERPFTLQRFQPKTGNFLCVLPVRLHNNGVLGNENTYFWKRVSWCKSNSRDASDTTYNRPYWYCLLTRWQHQLLAYVIQHFWPFSQICVNANRFWKYCCAYVKLLEMKGKNFSVVTTSLSCKHSLRVQTDDKNITISHKQSTPLHSLN